MNVLITGSAGFIGYSTALELLRNGHRVIGIDNFNDYYEVSLKESRNKILEQHEQYTLYRIDLSDLKKLDNVFSQEKIDVVCNLAAQAGVRYSIENPHVYMQSNMVGFLNLLECCRHYKIPRCVYASSSSVYGGNKEYPFSETHRVDTPISLYAASKKSNELMAHTYSHLYNFQTIGLRFFTVYGPWGRPDMALWLFTKAILDDKPIKVFNHGKMKRDFTFITDIVQGVIASITATNFDKYEIFNLGNNKTETLIHMIETLEEALGIEAKKEYFPMQDGDVPETSADVTAAREKLNYSPSTNISKGIPKFTQWYKEYHNIK